MTALRSWLLDVSLGISVAFAWAFRFGPLGSAYESDTAGFGAMALLPLDAESLYFWGQDRLGSVVSLLARPLVACHVRAAVAAQASALLCAAVGAVCLLHLLSCWWSKVCFASFLAFPSFLLAVNLGRAYTHHGVLLFLGLEVVAFEACRKRGSLGLASLCGCFAALLYWAGEPGILALLPQAVQLAREAWRAPWRRALAFALFTALGVAPGVGLIFFAKTHSIPTSQLGERVDFADARRTLESLSPQFDGLNPFLGAAGTYLLIALLFVAAAVIWFRPSSSVAGSVADRFLRLAPAPLLIVVATCFSKWFERNAFNARYLVLPVVLAIVSLCLLLDLVSERLPGGRAQIALAALALLLAGFSSARAAPGNNAARSQGQHWERKAAAIARDGCLGFVADYWESYPVFELTEGAVLATPHESQLIRSVYLAKTAVRQPDVCLRPWLELQDVCPATHSEFGFLLQLTHESQLSVDGEAIHLCHYQPASP